jgi:hypothetical protein
VPEPTTRKAAAKPDKAAAARAETTPEPRTVEFDGLTLTLATDFPEEIFFDMIESEASQAEGNPGNEYIVNLRLLRSLVGPDQFTDIRHRFGRNPEKVVDLVNAVLEQYGLTMGESSASPDS